MIGSCLNYTLFKANSAIQISNNLTILERKFFNVITYYVLKNPYEQFFNIPSFEFRKLTNIDVSCKKIEAILESLRTKKIELIKSTSKEFDNTGFISRAKFTSHGMLTIEVSQGLKDFLSIENAKLNGGYTELNLNILNRLHSTHSLALYELLQSKSFAKSSIDIDFQELILSLSKPKLYKKGQVSNYYQSYYRFNDDILKRAVAEINEKTDLKIQYSVIKFNSKVEKVNFIVQKQNTKQIFVADIQEIKEVIPVIKPNIDIDLSQYPQEIQQIIDIGIKPATKVIKWFEEDQRRVLANWYEVSTKYADKSNTEKAKLMAYLWKVNANYVTRAEIEAKEKEMAYNIKQEAIIKEQQKEQAQQEIRTKERVKQVFANTAKIYNQLSNNEKLELCTNICRNSSGILRLNKYTEDDKYLDFDKLGKTIQSFIMNEINPQKIDKIQEAPQVFLSYKNNEKKEADEALRNLLM